MVRCIDTNERKHMLDFTPVRQKTMMMQEFAQVLSRDELRQLTNESIDRMMALLDNCIDIDVTFIPDDPDARDDAAADPNDRSLAWTLGHNVVHATASGEEYAAVATEFARGVPFHGRPRYETPWQHITTVAQCRQRLEESRRIRVASLDMWPDEPHFEVGTVYWDGSGWVNAVGIFVWGLAHDDDHYRQMQKITHQAHAARSSAVLYQQT
jgi:hypothetical protein